MSEVQRDDSVLRVGCFTCATGVCSAPDPLRIISVMRYLLGKVRGFVLTASEGLDGHRSQSFSEYCGYYPEGQLL